MKEISSKEKNIIKIVLIGNSGVGKTCISQRYVNDSYIGQKECSTIGSSYFVKTVNINGKEYTLDIWDTAGQEKYRSIGKMFYKNAYIVLFVYDVTNKKSFIDLKNVWYDELIKTGEKKAVMAVVGNKNDLYLKEEVDENEAREWADEIGAIFGLVSAKTGDCINVLFKDILNEYFSPSFISQMGKKGEIELKGDENNHKSSCC